MDWPAYGRDVGGTRYSPAAQVTRENVTQLEVAWVYRTGDFIRGGNGTRFEATPLVVEGTLYVSTPFGRVIALDPETGEEKWAFDPRIDLGGDYGDFTNRGLANWLDPAAAPGVPCRRRIYVAPIDARVIALDAATGAPCRDFGTDGQVDLNRDLVNEPTYKGEYLVTSPPTVIGDLVISGSAIADNQRVDAPSGVVRAFDARTGRLRWRWDPIPRQPSDPGYDTWRGPTAHRTGAANAWSLLSADSERDLVFVPVGSASPDFYGGERLGQNLFANSVVALRASTGKLVWHFQVVHHDLWDYDVPAQPVLVTLRRDGREVPALVQPTKMGHIFVLHRDTGEPLFPLEERPVPASTVPGEEAWPTQPFPTRPPPLVPQKLTADDAWGPTPADREACRRTLQNLRSEGIFTPPSLEGAIVYPGNIGGSNWGGVAVDPVRGVAIAPVNRLATAVRLVPREDYDRARRQTRGEVSPQRGTPYGVARTFPSSPSGLPCSPPPWGTLSAVDLNTGEIRWTAPLGYPPGAENDPARRAWGSVNLGGAMITATGLVFVAGTLDQRLHAIDLETGVELWSAALPAGGNALPMTFQLGPERRQFVVIAAGGHGRMGTKQGDSVVAFALPAPREKPPAPPADFVGDYRGEFIVERRRYPATLALHTAEAAQFVGELEISAPAISGTLSGTQEGGRLEFALAFSYPEKNCRGVMNGAGELANGGRLLVGEVVVSGPCSGERSERGTFALRRQP
jgi:quinoprotein glucose dehydrogenase